MGPEYAPRARAARQARPAWVSTTCTLLTTRWNERTAWEFRAAARVPWGQAGLLDCVRLFRPNAYTPLAAEYLCLAPPAL